MSDDSGDQTLIGHYLRYYSIISSPGAEVDSYEASVRRNTVVIYERSVASAPPYVVLGAWAQWLSREVVRSEAAVREWPVTDPEAAAAAAGAAVLTTGGRIPTLTLNEALFKAAVIAIVKGQNKGVEVYKKPSSGVSSSCWLEQVDRITPSTVVNFEDDWGGGTADAAGGAHLGAVAALTCSEKTGGGGIQINAAILSASTRRLFVSQFTDTPHFSLLDCLLTQCGVQELEVPQNTPEGLIERLSGVCKRLAVTLEMKPSSRFSAATVATGAVGHAGATQGSKLMQLLFLASDAVVLDNLPGCQAALGCVLSHASTETVGCYRLLCVHPDALMKLETSAIEALNLISFHGEARRGALPISIYGWLSSRCSTAMGTRLMRQWMLQPLRSTDEISARLSVVEAMVESSLVRDALATQVFRHLSDVDRIVRKVHRKTASLRELCLLRPFVEALPAATRILKLYNGQSKKLLEDEFIQPIEEISSLLDNFNVLLDATIEVTQEREFRIKPEFDDEMMELAHKQSAVRKSIDDEYARILKVTHWTDKVCKCELHQSFGFILRVPRKEDRQLREGSRQFTIVNTAKDGVRFVSETLSHLSQQHTDFTKLYEARQESLHRKLTDTVASYIPLLDDAKDLLARLDVLCAWATVAVDSPMPMTKPELLPCSPDGQGSPISVVNCWHPLVQMRAPRCIPNSIRLDAGTHNAAIITGPNMGGKSTFMRSIAVAAVLAQIGCFVPCERMSLAPLDAVMCRVGATDHLAYGMSTFMVEMIETATIIEVATDKTLVVIDELGRGTSTYDGFGLAWAVARTLGAERRARVLFSTHFHELTTLAEPDDASRTDAHHFFNVHFSAAVEEGQLQFHYQLQLGACTKSFGIEVADQARLPAELIEDAKARAAELEDFTGEAKTLPAELQAVVIQLAAAIDKIRHGDLGESQKDANIAELVRKSLVESPQLAAYFKFNAVKTEVTA